MPDFDYIIVGSGAGGSVLAERLSADPGVQVLVIEAGGSDRSPVHLIPKGFAFTMTNPKYTRRFLTAPSGSSPSGDTWFRGRVVGGSTTINGQIWNRGAAADFDALGAANPGWKWDDFLRTYREIENFELGASDLRGAGGPVDVEIAAPPEQICEALMDSSVMVGMKRVDDHNASDEERVAYTQFTTRKGTRLSAARAFLRPALKRPNLTLLTRAEVDRIVFNGKRAVGVSVRRGGHLSEYRVRREVLVCCGALESPLLLERSGIGRGDVLARAGIAQLVESPNVGERLSEHRGLRYMYKVKGAKGFNHLVNTRAGQAVAGARYLATRQGFLAQGSASASTFFTAVEGDPRPDTVGTFNPVSTKSATLHDQRLATADEPGMMIAFYPLRPTSQGSVHVTGATLEDEPHIDPHFLSTDYDRSVVMGIGRRAQELFSTGPLADLVDEPRAPACTITDGELLVQHVLQAGASVYHTIGSCSMGPNPDDVVDARLRVRGVEGLRVVDASVFPYQPSANTSAPTQALASIAAAMILEDAHTV